MDQPATDPKPKPVTEPLVVPAAPPPPRSLAELDEAARSGLRELLARMPAQPKTAVLVLRQQEGLIIVPVGALGDVLEALEGAKKVAFQEGMKRFSYRLDAAGS